MRSFRQGSLARFHTLRGIHWLVPFDTEESFPKIVSDSTTRYAPFASYSVKIPFRMVTSHFTSSRFQGYILADGSTHTGIHRLPTPCISAVFHYLLYSAYSDLGLSAPFHHRCGLIPFPASRRFFRALKYIRLVHLRVMRAWSTRHRRSVCRQVACSIGIRLCSFSSLS